MIEIRATISEDQARVLHTLISQDSQYPKTSLYGEADHPLFKSFSDLADLGLIEFNILDDGMFEAWVSNAGIWIYEAIEYLPSDCVTPPSPSAHP